MLEHVYFARYRFVLEPKEALVFPYGNIGSVLRGALGVSLKRIVCLDTQQECLSCPLKEKCVYQVVFSPVYLLGDSLPARQRTPPRGFVIDPPLEGKDRYLPGEPLPFEMSLIGKINTFLPYIIVTFKELGRYGIGANRGKYLLKEITALKGIKEEPLYSAETGVVRNIDMKVTYPELAEGGISSLADGQTLKSPNRTTLHFITPTQIRHNPTGQKGESRVVREPEFHHIAKRLRDRIDALARFYCGYPLEMDFKGFGERAEKVKTVSRELRWIEQSRRSRLGHQHDLSGFVGRTTFEGDLAEFLPFLVLGQYLHVGENAVFGSGRYKVEK